MKRRTFIRIVGGAGLSSTLAPGYLLTARAGHGDADGVLLEAASFSELGGWKVDTQHYQQMGGCYLLAHGMGIPVANARTKAKLPEAGTWHIWVRTRDWCPGPWDAPGRFRVHINGKPLKTEFGTEQGWAWQKGGAVNLSSRDVTVELEDLTGFDGRCDAIYFSKKPAPKLPNDDLVELAAWKDRLTGRATKSIAESRYDLVVVGGGISGCAAVLAARREGLSVALIQDRPLFGGNASEEVRVHTIGIPGLGNEIIKTIDTAHYPNGHADAIKDQKKREATMKACGADLFAHHIAIGLQKDGDRIASVEARHAITGTIRRFGAPVFIDATGDAWLGYWAGADYRQGREASNEFNESWDKHGDLWSPKTPDKRVMGTSVLWNSEKTNQRSDFPAVPWALPVANGHVATLGFWYWEYSDNDLDQIDDAEQIRDHVLRAIYGSFANAKKHPKNAAVKLKFVAYVGGKRESRRLMGDYIYTMHDMTEGRKFPDAVVWEKRDIDVHYQRAETGLKQDFLSTALFMRVPNYYLPFRTLYSRNVANLMMAGRCFSCSHIGLGGPRVMKTCGQMGIATGFAAALCKKHKTDPRGVHKNHIGQLKDLCNLDGDSAAFSGIQILPPGKARRASDDGSKYTISNLPKELDALPSVVTARGSSHHPAPGFSFQINAPALVYIAVHQRGKYIPPAGWKETKMVLRWYGKYTDVIYHKSFKAGTVKIPGHDGKDGSIFGLPHMAFVKGSGVSIKPTN